ncbi:hypothetical protein PF003_g33376 [Phytophthora fragariae]|nr:hypothetical protein PF003_g33376 [Phytophthora fragariae]
MDRRNALGANDDEAATSESDGEAHHRDPSLTSATSFLGAASRERWLRRTKVDGVKSSCEINGVMSSCSSAFNR